MSVLRTSWTGRCAGSLRRTRIKLKPTTRRWSRRWLAASCRSSMESRERAKPASGHSVIASVANGSRAAKDDRLPTRSGACVEQLPGSLFRFEERRQHEHSECNDKQKPDWSLKSASDVSQGADK